MKRRHTWRSRWKTQTPLKLSVKAALAWQRPGCRAESHLCQLRHVWARRARTHAGTHGRNANTHLGLRRCLHEALHTARGHAAKPCVSVTTISCTSTNVCGRYTVRRTLAGLVPFPCPPSTPSVRPPAGSLCDVAGGRAANGAICAN